MFKNELKSIEQASYLEFCYYELKYIAVINVTCNKNMFSL